MVDNSNDYLAHYGVIGMKWGIRRDPQRAYDRAAKKRARIRKKVKAYVDSANWHKQRASYARPDPIRSVIFGQDWKNSRTEEMFQHMHKATMYEVRAAKATKRGEHWCKSMRKAFKNVTLNSIEAEDYGRIPVSEYGEVRYPE